MILNYIYSACILFIFWCSIHASEGCDNGWFGFYCQYKCHCENDFCDSDGLCTNNVTCSTGWFGYKCQYSDLIRSASNLKSLPNWLTDNSITTCNNNTYQLNQSIVITWDTGYIIRFVRIVVKNETTLTRFKLRFSTLPDEHSTETVCQKERLVVRDETTLDFQCITNPNVTIQKIVLDGEGLTELCTFKINGGRNVALKQNTSQSSTGYDGYSYKAVDGGTDQTYRSQAFTCTHTAETTGRKNWTLTYKERFVINRFVLYNRGDCCKERLSNFVLETFNDQDQLVYNLTNSSTSEIYRFIHYSDIPIHKLTITATKVLTDGNTILTLCEVETYGDCTPGKWSLECNKTCENNCTDTCNIEDGKCSTACVGFSNPPLCDEECRPGTWGVNCSQVCNSKCYEKCNIVNGFCDQGCLGYSNPPICNTVCASNKFGRNCSNQCTSNCLNGTCDRNTGICWECIPGYTGDQCEEECTFGFWGSKCSQSCSENCFQTSCNKTDGMCDKGCIGFQNPPICNLRCSESMFGHNCTQTCSPTCYNSTCDAITGLCRQCVDGYQGEYCTMEVAVVKANEVGIIAGTSVAVFVVICVIVAVLLLVIRHRRTKSSEKPNTEFSQQKMNKLESDFTDSYKDEMKELAEVDPKNIYQYENQVIELEEDTSIDIKELNTFMEFCNKQYFEARFKEIPVPKDVSTEAAISSENKNKNRYKNICPYDHSRVHLEINVSRNEGDYINASYIQGYKKEEMFIASQAPTKVIVNDFIRMLWEQKVDKVVMLTNLIEDGKTKCEKYWPEDGTVRFGEISVTLKANQVFADYSIRSLELSKRSDESHTLTQFHFTSWPDKDVPPTPWNLVEFKHRVCLSPTTKPIVVHCSAGVGRTGTFIALWNVMRQAEKTGRVDFYKTVALLREDRIFMVQTASQYEFLHRAAQVAIMCIRSTMTANDFSTRYVTLNNSTSLQDIHLETEYKDLCSVCDNLRKCENDKDTSDSVYQNSDTIITSHQNIDTSALDNTNFRITLTKESKEMTDYIHAILLPGYKRKDQNILTHLPSTTTAIDVWRLVVQQNIGLVVAFEMGSNDQSDENYFPYSSDERITQGPYEVHTTMIKRSANWEERMITVSSKKSFFKTECHNVIHLRCLFSDVSVDKMLSLMKKARSYNLASGKTIYMCRNGAKYSGLAYILSLLMDRLDNDSCIAVPLVVGAVKSIVPDVIPDLDQYLLIHKVLHRYIDISCNYSNVGEDFLQKVNSNSNKRQENQSQETNVDVYANV